MAASIFLSSGCRRGRLGDVEIVSVCGKTMRDFLSGKSYLTQRFIGYESAKVSQVRRDLQESSHPEREFLLNQIKNLKGRDEISVG